MDKKSSSAQNCGLLLKLLYFCSPAVLMLQCAESFQEKAAFRKSKTVSSIGTVIRVEGRLNWKAAVQKCADLNARLLSKEELAFIYESDQKNEWVLEGPSYWSSQEKSAENAFYMNMKTGYFGYLFKSFPYSVKCIRL